MTAIGQNFEIRDGKVFRPSGEQLVGEKGVWTPRRRQAEIVVTETADQKDLRLRRTVQDMQAEAVEIAPDIDAIEGEGAVETLDREGIVALQDKNDGRQAVPRISFNQEKVNYVDNRPSVMKRRRLKTGRKG
jgi:hypothetical protein